jgi:hypothetical protein
VCKDRKHTQNTGRLQVSLLRHQDKCSTAFYSVAFKAPIRLSPFHSPTTTHGPTHAFLNSRTSPWICTQMPAFHCAPLMLHTEATQMKCVHTRHEVRTMHAITHCSYKPFLWDARVLYQESHRGEGREYSTRESATRIPQSRSIFSPMLLLGFARKAIHKGREQHQGNRHTHTSESQSLFTYACCSWVLPGKLFTKAMRSTITSHTHPHTHTYTHPPTPKETATCI